MIFLEYVGSRACLSATGTDRAGETKKRFAEQQTSFFILVRVQISSIPIEPLFSFSHHLRSTLTFSPDSRSALIPFFSSLHLHAKIPCQDNPNRRNWAARPHKGTLPRSNNSATP